MSVVRSRIPRTPRGTDPVGTLLQSLLNRTASEEIHRDAIKFSYIQEEEKRKDARLRVVYGAIADGFSSPTATKLDSLIFAFRESLDPWTHGLTPPFSQKIAGRRRKPAPPARWRKPRYFAFLGDE